MGDVVGHLRSFTPAFSVSKLVVAEQRTSVVFTHPAKQALWKRFKNYEIVPKNRTASLVVRKPVNCCHYEKKQTKIQCGI
jgi:hypothetical protein